MINKQRFNSNQKSKLFCTEPEKIENYELAISDKENVWECHHRLETHTSNGDRRLVQLTKQELEALDTYLNRPPEEFIFLTESEHRDIHKGKKRSEKTKQKMSQAAIGRFRPNKAGKPNKPVICIETGVLYESVSKAARVTGLRRATSICSACNEINKTAGGFHWKYA